MGESLLGRCSSSAGDATTTAPAVAAPACCNVLQLKLLQPSSCYMCYMLQLLVGIWRVVEDS